MKKKKPAKLEIHEVCKDQTSEHRIWVRIPLDLWVRFEAEAKASERNYQAEMRYILKSHFKI